MQFVNTDIRDGNCWITLNRPEAMNALNEQIVQELIQAIENIEEPGIPLIFTGTGRAFSAGADLKNFLENLNNSDGLRRYFNLLSELFERIYGYEGVTIAAVNGITVAGGLELMCLCDLAIAADCARFADGHSKYGLHPGGGASVLLRQMVGERMGRWLLLSGEYIDAATALHTGLVNRVVAKSSLVAEAEKLAGAIPRNAHEAMRRTKRLINSDLKSIIERECDSLIELLQHPETRAQLDRFAARSGKKP